MGTFFDLVAQFFALVTGSLPQFSDDMLLFQLLALFTRDLAVL